MGDVLKFEHRPGFAPEPPDGRIAELVKQIVARPNWRTAAQALRDVPPEYTMRMMFGLFEDLGMDEPAGVRFVALLHGALVNGIQMAEAVEREGRRAEAAKAAG